jgi:hypothetical protein
MAAHGSNSTLLIPSFNAFENLDVFTHRFIK